MFLSFQFNGKESSEYHLKIGHLNSPTQDESPLLALTNNYIRHKNSRFTLASSYIETPLELQNISIIKDHCQDSSSFFITREELENINKWLTSTKSGKLVLHLKDKTDAIMNGMFYEIKEKYYNDLIIGYDLKFKSESPFIFKNEISSRYTNTSLITIESNTLDFASLSTIQPIFEITVLEEGDLIFWCTNGSTSIESTKIKDCKINEVITIDSKNEIITSTNKDINRRFNYHFPCLIKNQNAWQQTTNTNYYHFSKKVNVSIKYTPLRLGVGLFG